METPEEIIKRAIEEWKPIQIVCLFSGGYDSMVMAHVGKSVDLDVPVATWAIDTKMAADGWYEYVQAVADELEFPDFNIYDNTKGFDEYVKWVTDYGCPRGEGGHNRAYARLKERGMDAIHMMYKRKKSDKTLFFSGMRKYESVRREKMMHDPVQRMRKSNKIFANPLFYWRDEDVARYRIENDLPDNPFYSTVKGSGDCQCNWGNFISMGTLKIYSPQLAAGNVGVVDKISRKSYGYGWDGEKDGEKLFDTSEYISDGVSELTTPFLCSNCSRKGNKVEAIEAVMLQRGMF